MSQKKIAHSIVILIMPMLLVGCGRLHQASLHATCDRTEASVRG